MNSKASFFFAWPPFDHQRPMLLVVVAGVAVNLAAALLIAEQQWIYVGIAVGVLVVASLLLLRPATCLSLAFVFLPFQPVLNDVFSGSTPLVAIGKDVLMVVIIVSVGLNHLLLRRS